jgi:hypothetical protein
MRAIASRCSFRLAVHEALLSLITERAQSPSAATWRMVPVPVVLSVGYEQGWDRFAAAAMKSEGSWWYVNLWALSSTSPVLSGEWLVQLAVGLA